MVLGGQSAWSQTASNSTNQNVERLSTRTKWQTHQTPEGCLWHWQKTTKRSMHGVLEGLQRWMEKPQQRQQQLPQTSCYRAKFYIMFINMFINVLGLIRSHLWHLTKPSEAFQHSGLRVWLLDRYEGHASFIAHSQLLESQWINENRSKSSTVFTSKQSSGSIECSYQTLKKLQNLSCPKSQEYPHPEKPCTVYTANPRNPNKKTPLFNTEVVSSIRFREKGPRLTLLGSKYSQPRCPSDFGHIFGHISSLLSKRHSSSEEYAPSWHWVIFDMEDSKSNCEGKNTQSMQTSYWKHQSQLF